MLEFILDNGYGRTSGGQFSERAFVLVYFQKLQKVGLPLSVLALFR